MKHMLKTLVDCKKDLKRYEEMPKTSLNMQMITRYTILYDILQQPNEILTLILVNLKFLYSTVLSIVDIK